MSHSLRPNGLQHSRLPCPSPTPRACSNSCPLSRWCHPTISSSAVPYHTENHMNSVKRKQFSSVAQLCPTLWPHESQHARPPCPSPAPRVHSDSRPSSQRCHPAISSSVVPFSSCPQSLPASKFSPVSQLFAWGGQSTGVSAVIKRKNRNLNEDFTMSES